MVAVDARRGEVPCPQQRRARAEEVGAVELEDGVAVHVGDGGDGGEDVGGGAEPVERLAPQGRVGVVIGCEDEGVDQPSAPGGERRIERRG